MTPNTPVQRRALALNSTRVTGEIQRHQQTIDIELTITANLYKQSYHLISLSHSHLHLHLHLISLYIPSLHEHAFDDPPSHLLAPPHSKPSNANNRQAHFNATLYTSRYHAKRLTAKGVQPSTRIPKNITQSRSTSTRVLPNDPPNIFFFFFSSLLFSSILLVSFFSSL